MNNIANNSFSYSYNITKDNKAMLAVNLEQGLIYNICLNKKKLLTKAFNLNHILTEF
jgi:hypothetical protein